MDPKNAPNMAPSYGMMGFTLVVPQWPALPAHLGIARILRGAEPQLCMPAHLYEPYTRADDQYLWAHRNEPVEVLAEALGRGPRSCVARLKRLRDPSTEGHRRLFGVCEEALSDAKETALRPARDVIQRILHDPALSVSDFVVGYRDRFETATLECPFDAPNESIRGRERSMVAALPEHRIEYFVYRGQLVWHKGQRLDDVFGSRGGARLKDVIAQHGAWEQVRKRRLRSARMHALAALGGSTAKLGSFVESLGQVRRCDGHRWALIASDCLCLTSD